MKVEFWLTVSFVIYYPPTPPLPQGRITASPTNRRSERLGCKGLDENKPVWIMVLSECDYLLSSILPPSLSEMCLIIRTPNPFL
jgi:hypothetical protein